MAAATSQPAHGPDVETSDWQDGETMDWLGRPGAGRRLGGWRSGSCIIGISCFTYMAFGGLFLNLVLYLIHVWHESPATAANHVTNVMGTMFFTSLIGAFLGDTSLGRLWTFLLFLGVYFMGSILLCIVVTIQEHYNGVVSSSPPWMKGFLFLTLYIVAVGGGSFEPVGGALGGDQFKSPNTRAIFFNWIFVSSNIGQLVSLTIITYIENKGNWALGFWISSAALLVSIAIFFVGAPMYKQTKTRGNPFLRVLQVLVCATRNHWISMLAEKTRFYEDKDGQRSNILGSQKVNHIPKFRWLDKATLKQQGTTESPWHVCPITQVEETKRVVQILPFVVVGIFTYTLAAQVTTFFIEQGASMDNRLGRTQFKIAPGSMQVLTTITTIVFAPMYDYMLAPWLRKRTHQEKGLTTLQRVGCGILISIVCSIIAALVERARLQVARLSLHEDPHENIIPMSILWLSPQYVLVGISALFIVVGLMDFFYSELSEDMKSFGMCLPLICSGLGNYASTLLVSIITHLNLDWLPTSNNSTLNHGHLDYFYWLITLLLALTFFSFIILARSYTYIHVHVENPIVFITSPLDITNAKR